MSADLERRPPAGAVRDRSAVRGDAGIGLGECHHRTGRVRASPALLQPHQPGPPSEARHIGQPNLVDTVAPHASTTTRTHWSRRSSGDRDPPKQWPVADPDHGHVKQPDKEFAHARRIGFQQGLLGSTTLDTVRFAEPLCRARDLPHPHPTHRSEEPAIPLGPGAAFFHPCRRDARIARRLVAAVGYKSTSIFIRRAEKSGDAKDRSTSMGHGQPACVDGHGHAQVECRSVRQRRNVGHGRSDGHPITADHVRCE